MTHMHGPPTPRKIEAQRRNAQKSTGPRTRKGKRRVRLNALKHGLYSRAQSLWESMLDLGEDPREFLRLLRDLIAARQPADAVEMMLVESVEKDDFSKDAEPLLRALYGEEATLQGAAITNLFRRLQGSGEASAELDSHRAALRRALLEETRDVAEEYQMFLQERVQISPAMRQAALAPTEPAWTLLIRQENALSRQIERKLKLLEQIQRSRAGRAPLPAPEGPTRHVAPTPVP